MQGRINDLTEKTGGGTFGMEFVLTYLVVYAFCAAREPRLQLRLGYTK